MSFFFFFFQDYLFSSVFLLWCVWVWISLSFFYFLHIFIFFNKFRKYSTIISSNNLSDTFISLHISLVIFLCWQAQWCFTGLWGSVHFFIVFLFIPSTRWSQLSRLNFHWFFFLAVDICSCVTLVIILFTVLFTSRISVWLYLWFLFPYWYSLFGELSVSCFLLIL